MTASTETTETTTDNRVEPEQEVEDATTGDDRPGAEAARYRRRLRETETQLAGLAERLAGYQRAEVERLAAATLSKPGDVWLDGRELGDLLDDAGQIDAAKVAAEVDAVTAERPQLRVARVRPKPDDAQGGRMPAPASGWKDVLKGRQ